MSGGMDRDPLEPRPTDPPSAIERAREAYDSSERLFSAARSLLEKARKELTSTETSFQTAEGNRKRAALAYKKVLDDESRRLGGDDE